MTSMLRSYRKMPESKRRDIQVLRMLRSRLVNLKHELIASVIAGASITIWYDSTAVDVSINLLSECGFFRIYMDCLRQIRTRIRTRKLVWWRVKLNIMDHFPTNWGRPVSLRPKSILFHAEVEYSCRSTTVSTTMQPIHSITAVMPSQQHPMVPCNTHSVFFQALPRFLI